MNKLVKGNLVRGLPTKVFENDNICVACRKGKQHRASCKTKPVSSVNQPLHRFHMDLFGPTFVKSLDKKNYCLVVTDDYSRFTWVCFLATKDETSPILKTFITGLENQFSLKVKVIRSDNGIEFKNNDLNLFCGMKMIKREFSVPRTPQQNGIAKRKNRTLIEAAKTMLADSLLPIPFWAEADNNVCDYPESKNVALNQGSRSKQEDDSRIRAWYINQQYVFFPVWSSGSTNPLDTDGDAVFDENEPEFEGRKPESEVSVSPSSSAQSKKHDDKIKREAKGKSPIESLIGYRKLSVEFEDFSDNSINEDNAASILVPAVGQFSSNSANTFSVAGPSNIAASPTHKVSSYVGAEADFNNLETSITVSHIPTIRVHKDHPVTQIIGDLSLATQTRSMIRVAKDQEPKRVHQALKDPSLIEAMQEELLQFIMQKVWVLVDLPCGKRAIGTKWVFRNKKDERDIIVRNKARLVTEGHTQDEGIHYEEVFAPVANIKAIRLFLAYASFMGFMVYQLDVKSAFLYGTIEEEGLCKAFEKLMKDKFQMSSMGELTFFLGLQVKQKEDGIFISQDKYVADILRNFGLIDGKSASTLIDTEKPLLKDPDGEDVDVYTYRSMIGSLMYLTSSRPDIMFAVCACACFHVTPKALHLHEVKKIFRYLKGKPHLGLWYSKDSPFDLVAYSDSDYAGASLDRKSTTGGCQFLGCRLISWKCKKKTVMATSSTEAEYVAAASCCAQVLWIQNQLLDYGSIKYALTVNPNIYVLCIKQFWTTVAVKKVNDVTRLQALVDKKKVVVTEAAIRDVLCLDDAEGVECLPNVEIFIELARMGYEKPFTKLTFYKALSQASGSDLSSHSTKYTSPALTQKVFANMRWVGKEFSRVDTPLFKGMLVVQEVDEGDADEVHVEDVNAAGVAEDAASVADDEVNVAVDEPSIPSNTPPTPPPQPLQDQPSTSQDKVAQALEITKLKQRVKKLEKKNKDVVLEDAKDVTAVEESTADLGRQAESQAKIYKIDLEHAKKVLSMQEEESNPAKLQEVVDVVTIAKLITKVVTAASTTITAADALILAATIAAAPTLTAAFSRRRKGVVIRDPKETTTTSTIIHSEAKSKDKGKGILKAKKDNAVKRYQALKKKPQTEAQARKNMMIYLKNVVGFKMDYFKGMSYDDIRLIFEQKFNSNVAFLLKIKEQIDEEESRALKRLNESQKDKALKKQKLDEEVKELKRHLQIVPNNEDDVYTKATPLALKVPVVDYEIYNENNKLHYKIKRADGSHQLYLSFLSLLRNFYMEDLEAL
uniref:Putative ribonuclease H-like domain-containing protein n=1 Tax=Tanacetum cinerariifolium TaxID=118510 RepID=A0A6L2KDI3_TANCI|nr:putative ribonuclease H-like domain-containing protein [Tanacetum cinerariifolium]